METTLAPARVIYFGRSAPAWSFECTSVALETLDHAVADYELQSWESIYYYRWANDENVLPEDTVPEAILSDADLSGANLVNTNLEERSPIADEAFFDPTDGKIDND
jgi:hypothetical protein